MDGEQLAIATTEAGDTLVMRVDGELDLLTVPQFTASMSQCLALGPRVVEVDAAGVTFIDSSGLHALLNALRDATAAGAELRVVTPSTVVDQVLDMSGVGEMLRGEAAGLARDE